MLVGTWAAAEWAIRLYRRHGFEMVSSERTAVLLQTYWSIPDGQSQSSVVLAKPPLDEPRGNEGRAPPADGASWAGSC